MKFYFFFLTPIFFLAGANAQQVQSVHENDFQTGFSHDQATGVNNRWFTEAVANLRQLEYAFYQQKEQSLFKVVNAENRIGFSIGPDAYSVQNIQIRQEEKTWKVDFAMKGFGRNALNGLSTAFSIFQENDRITYRYTNSISIEYVNNASGLRQNFIIANRPSGEGNLRVSMYVKGDLHVKLLSPGQLGFYRNEGETIFIYEDLKAWDANGNTLSSFMQYDEESRELDLVVNDENAAYPVTIDPLNKSPEWSSSVNGVISTLLTQTQLQAALYGYTVASLGDVNADGYGDAAIAAPALVDVFSGNGTLASVGAVFIFYGSAVGLSATPGKTLQPATAIAGALFGASIDAGDVTGDGINDIVIGAPLDKATIQLGILNIDGPIGKVYVYPGGVSSASNPTNFKTIQLNSAFVDLTNISNNALFGFSVAVTEDLNGDSKKDILVGSPTYMGTGLLNAGIKTGAAFEFLSNASNTFTIIQSLQLPSFNLLGINLPLISSINGLLFGYSVDGVGDYNSDGRPDIVVGAPAGIDLSNLTGVLTGQVLGGQAYVYYGTQSKTGINTVIGAKLQASSTGLLSNAANLFGYKVKGVRNGVGVYLSRNGNIVVGAPMGGALPNTLGLTIQTGNVQVFKKKAASPQGIVRADQVLESPRSGSLLELLNTLNLNLLFGTSIDNAYDINCDGYPDLVAGEPLSSGTNILQLQTVPVGGAAHVFLGDGTGGYLPAPAYSISATYGSDFLSVNATALFGYSVAGIPRASGFLSAPRVLAGSPSGALDFNGLLNLGGTLGLLFDFTIGNNGLGKSYLFNAALCNQNVPLSVNLSSFTAVRKNRSVLLMWTALDEMNIDHYEVEKSSDKTNFSVIANVRAKNNSRKNDYALVDERYFTGMNYYRLKIVNSNGQYDYSPIVAVYMNDQQKNDMTVFPNPVKKDFRVRLNGFDKGYYRLELRNVSGHICLAKNILINQAEYIEPMTRGNNMLSGMYWMIIYNKNTEIKRMAFIAD